MACRSASARVRALPQLAQHRSEHDLHPTTDLGRLPPGPHRRSPWRRALFRRPGSPACRRARSRASADQRTTARAPNRSAGTCHPCPERRRLASAATPARMRARAARYRARDSRRTKSAPRRLTRRPRAPPIRPETRRDDLRASRRPCGARPRSSAAGGAIPPGSSAKSRWRAS